MPAISKYSNKSTTKKIRKMKKSKKSKKIQKPHLKEVVKKVVQEVVQKKTRKASPKFDSVVTPVYKKFLLEAGVDAELIKEALIKAEAELNPKFLLHARKPRAKKPSKAKKAKAPKKKALEDISEAKSAEDLASNNVKSLKTWLKQQDPKIKLTALKKRDAVIGAVMWKITGEGDEPTMVAPKPAKKAKKEKAQKLDNFNEATESKQLEPSTIGELKAWLKDNTKVKVSALKNKKAMISAIMFIVTGEGDEPEFKKSKKKEEKKVEVLEQEDEESDDEESDDESDDEESDEDEFGF
jgi:hypothetical protein